MGNKTIYVKDDALWERAKKLAGKEGFSALISSALAEFVERKEDERSGMTEHIIDGSFGPILRRLRFRGRRLASGLLDDEKAEVFETAAGKFVLVRREPGTEKAYDHGIYDSLDQLGDVILGSGNEDFLEALAEAKGHKWTEWID